MCNCNLGQYAWVWGRSVPKATTFLGYGPACILQTAVYAVIVALWINENEGNVCWKLVEKVKDQLILSVRWTLYHFAIACLRSWVLQRSLSSGYTAIELGITSRTSEHAQSISLKMSRQSVVFSPGSQHFSSLATPSGPLRFSDPHYQISKCGTLSKRAPPLKLTDDKQCKTMHCTRVADLSIDECVYN